MKNRAVVLLSGGQDSTTCLYWAKVQFANVLAVGFNYGQRHRQELIQAGLIAQQVGVPFHVFDATGLLSGSSLVDGVGHHNQSHQRDTTLPASFTPGRNAMFLTVAAGYAYNQGVTELVTGVCQTDFSGYPDCRREFVDAMEKALTLAMAPPEPFTIHTPLMYLTKAETWRLAVELGCFEVVRDYTLTDYNGTMKKNDWGYGVEDNPATILRANGYREALANGWIPAPVR